MNNSNGMPGVADGVAYHKLWSVCVCVFRKQKILVERVQTYE